MFMCSLTHSRSNKVFLITSLTVIVLPGLYEHRPRCTRVQHMSLVCTYICTGTLYMCVSSGSLLSSRLHVLEGKNILSDKYFTREQVHKYCLLEGK